MENILCDELIQEIFQKLPSSSSYSITLVSKRWLHLYRSSKTSLSLHFNGSDHFSFISFLHQHLSLSSLTLSSSTSTTKTTTTLLLSAIFSSPCSSKLVSLKFLVSPVSLSSIVSLSNYCTQLKSLSITVSRSNFFNWVLLFPCLKHLSIFFSHDVVDEDGFCSSGSNFHFQSEEDSFEFEKDLGLESLCFEGIRGDDWGIGWLWKRCKNLKNLKLLRCQGIGASYSCFVQCLQKIQHIELKTCRTVVDNVLLKLAENSNSLESLLVHDGGSKDGLLNFILNSSSKSTLRKLDFRLPMDLENNHLFAIAMNFRNISSLKLQSCCLVNGEGLKAFGVAMSNGLEELALINCDIVEREKGLLATLGQNLRQLRKLDLSHNEMLFDKDFGSMLVSCTHLVDLKIRGCKGLTNLSITTMIRSCKRLENVDIKHCLGFEFKAIELFLKNCLRLRKLEVEGSKISDDAKMWASNKFIQLVV